MNVRQYTTAVAVVLGWVLLALAGATLAGHLMLDDDEVNWLPRNAESTRAIELADRAFPRTSPLAVVYVRAGGLVPADRAAAEAARTALSGLAAGPIPPPVVSADRRALLVTVSEPAAAVDPTSVRRPGRGAGRGRRVPAGRARRNGGERLQRGPAGGPGLRRGHRLRAAAHVPLPRGTPPRREPVHGDDGRPAPHDPGRLGLRRRHHRRTADPPRRRHELHPRPRPGRRGRRRREHAGDDHRTTRPARPLRPRRVLARRPPRRDPAALAACQGRAFDRLLDRRRPCGGPPFPADVGRHRGGAGLAHRRCSHAVGGRPDRRGHVHAPAGVGHRPGAGRRALPGRDHLARPDLRPGRYGRSGRRHSARYAGRHRRRAPPRTPAARSASPWCRETPGTPSRHSAEPSTAPSRPPWSAATPPRTSTRPRRWNAT